LFYSVFGGAWFIGSALMGFLYEKSLVTLIVFSVACQLLALPVILYGASETKAR
jgi:predicted MFS family arabinose efflux permease